MDIQGIFRKYALKLETTYDVDTTDRFKYTYTTWILLFSSFFSLAQSIIQRPMKCWTPAQFHSSWQQYIENYCYVEGSYFVPFNSSNLPDLERRSEEKVKYYQWVPFILLLYALVTYSPRLLWKKIQSFQNVQIASVTAVSRKNAKYALHKGSHEELCDKQTADDIHSLIHRWRLGNLLTVTLLFTKLVSLLVIIVQLVSLNWFLSGEVFNFYGFRLLSDLLHNHDWLTSGVFPRTTFCDVQVREMATVQTWTVQCVLPANMYYEKLFLLVWIWYFFLTIISAVNWIKWIHWSVPFNQVAFLTDVVKIFDEDAPLPKVQRLFRRVTTDGATVVRLVKENSNLYNAAKYLKPTWDDMEEFKLE